MVDVSGIALGTLASERLWRAVFNLHHGRNHGESDAGQSRPGSLLGDDRREAFCRLAVEGGNTTPWI